jgi:predicted RNA-binding protein with TRAM domain
VKVGDELEVTIEAVGVKGDGIAKKDGFVLFVPNTKAGQKLKIRITKVLRKVGFAEAVGGSASAPAAEASSEAPAEAAPVEEPAAEDSEDFGDEEQPQQP